VLREWNKGEVYSRAFICPASLRRGEQSPQNRALSPFFSTPARHVQGTEYAFHALANQKALLVKLGRLF
jgi:hypothetical protein